MSSTKKQTFRPQPSYVFKNNEQFSPASEIHLRNKPDQYSSHSEWPKILACLSTTFLHTPLGAVLAYSAILIPQLKSTDTEIKVTKEDISWIASVVALVMPLGSLVTGYLVDRVGRLNTLKTGCLPNIVGWACIATAQNIPIIMVGRILTGFSIPMITNPAFVYIPEVIAPELRGTLSSIAPTFTAVGLITVYTAGALLYWRTVAWMIMLYSLLPPLLVSILTSESPVWLVSKGRNEDALKSLYFLNRNKKQIGVAEQQLNELVMEQNIKQSLPENNGLSLLTFLKGLTKPTGFKPFFLLFSMFVFQQFSGTYICIFYAPTFFKSVGATIDPYVSTVNMGAMRLVFGLLTSLLMKHIGRRPLLMISGSGMALTMFLAGYINKKVVADEMEPNILPTVCILMYMSLAVTGLVTLPWIMTAELFPLENRGLSQGLIVSLAHILMFASIKTYPFLKDILGSEHATMWLFAGLSLSSVLFVFLFFPETHKKTLLEIQDYFMHDSVFYLCAKKQKETKRGASEGVVGL